MERIWVSPSAHIHLELNQNKFIILKTNKQTYKKSAKQLRTEKSRRKFMISASYKEDCVHDPCVRLCKANGHYNSVPTQESKYRLGSGKHNCIIIDQIQTDTFFSVPSSPPPARLLRRTADGMQKLSSSHLRIQFSTILALKPRLNKGQNIALHALRTAHNSGF